MSKNTTVISEPEGSPYGLRVEYYPNNDTFPKLFIEKYSMNEAEEIDSIGIHKDELQPLIKCLQRHYQEQAHNHD